MVGGWGGDGTARTLFSPFVDGRGIFYFVLEFPLFGLIRPYPLPSRLRIGRDSFHLSTHSYCRLVVVAVLPNVVVTPVP